MEQRSPINETGAENIDPTVTHTTQVTENTSQVAEHIIQETSVSEEIVPTATPTTEQKEPMPDEAAECVSGTQCFILITALLAVAVLVVVLGVWRPWRKKTSAGNRSGGRPSGAKSELVEIYVGNLSYDMNDNQLRREFERFGVVKSARVITHRTNGKSKGYGFVEMPHRKEAGYAIKALDNSEVMGRRIRVNEARANTRPSDK